MLSSSTAKFGVRLFSSAPKTVSHAPPKKLHGMPGRYAEAVYVAASKASLLDTVEGELKAFKSSMLKNPSFNSFLKNPTLSRKEKVEKIGDLLQEDKISYISRNLFLVLAANGRMGDTAKVIESYEELMQANRGIVKAVIITAEPLDKKSLKSVEAAVVKLAGEGKTVDLKVEVNPKIMGGLQIMVGDKFVDLSVSSRVADLQKSLETTSL